MTRAGIIPLSSIERIQIYTKGCKSTKANLKKILKETGGDFITNGSIFLRNGKPCCHLRADGKTLCTPSYRAWAISWTEPSDYGVKTVSNADTNYMECVHIIIAGKKIDPINCGADKVQDTPCSLWHEARTIRILRNTGQPEPRTTERSAVRAGLGQRHHDGRWRLCVFCGQEREWICRRRQIHSFLYCRPSETNRQ